MKILYNHRTRASGADKVHIIEVVRAFQQLNHHVDIMSPPGVNFQRKDRESNVNAAGILKKLRFNLPRIIFELLEIVYNVFSYYSICKRVAENHYNLIYERYAIFNMAGAFASSKMKIPLILEISFTAKSPNLFVKRSGLLSGLSFLCEKFIFDKALKIVVVTKKLKEELKASGVKEDKIIVLPNAVDLARFDRNISGSKVREKLNINNKIVVGFVGGFSPWHGLDMLIDSLVDIIKENNTVVFLLVGDGPIRLDMERKVEALSLREFVKFLGAVEHENLAEVIAAFDIGILPDTNDYGSPMKIFEYMAMAKPVVAPSVGPIEEVITHNNEGLLFPPKDSRAMASCLRMLLQNGELRFNIGQQGYEKVMKNYTWKLNVSKIIEGLE